MATTVDKIKDIEAEMAKTQKNKATSFHLGQLKAKLAKLKRELLTPSSGGGGGGSGFDVARTGILDQELWLKASSDTSQVLPVSAS